MGCRADVYVVRLSWQVTCAVQGDIPDANACKITSDKIEAAFGCVRHHWHALPAR